MLEDPGNHPGDEVLRALSLGELADTELVRVAAHLSDCPDCCRRIDQLDVDDWLVDRLRQFAGRKHETLVSPAQLRAAARALRHWNDVRTAARNDDPAPGTGEIR